MRADTGDAMRHFIATICCTGLLAACAATPDDHRALALPGKWDWRTSEPRCVTLGLVRFLSHPMAARSWTTTSSTKCWPTRARRALRAVGETRQTDAGALVEWNLLMLNADTFCCWRRTGLEGGRVHGAAEALRYLIGSAMSAIRVSTSACVAALAARSMTRFARCGANSCTKSSWYLRSSPPRRKPIHVVWAGKRCDVSICTRSASSCGSIAMLATIADAEPEAHVGLDHVSIARGQHDVRHQSLLREDLKQRRRAGEAEHVRDDRVRRELLQRRRLVLRERVALGHDDVPVPAVARQQRVALEQRLRARRDHEVDPVQRGELAQLLGRALVGAAALRDISRGTA